MKAFLSFACVACVAALGAWLAVAPAAQQPSPSGALTIEKLVDIRHPSSPMWSPDGRSVVFVWDRAGVSQVYVADASGASAPRELREAGSGLGGAFWSADGKALLMARGGDLWRVPTDGSAASAVWTTPAAESGIVPSPDGSRVAFVRSTGASAANPAGRGGRGRGGAGGGGDLIVRSIADGRETVVLRAGARAIGALSWSPDGQTLVFNDLNAPVRHEQTPDYSGAKIIYTITENVPGETHAVTVPGAVAAGSGPGGDARSLGTLGGFGGRRWLDARHFLVDRTSPDFKRRTTSLVDVAGGEPKVLHEDVKEKFWSITGDAQAGALPSPDGKWIAFLSDRDGWDHLYVMPAAGGAAVQITRGKFEAWRPSWSPDGTRIAFDANQPDNYGIRHLYVATIGADPSHATIAPVTTGRGTNIAPQWSPDGTRLVYQHTDPHNSADLWVADVASKKTARLTDSMPA
jgi:Tol biopolymer transport system component